MTSLLLALCVGTTFSQLETVRFDYEKSYFNEGQPLPSESNQLFTGAISDMVSEVEINIFSAKGKADRAPLYNVTWRKPHNKIGGEFAMPVNFKFRASSEYDVRIDYYRAVSEKERAEIKKTMYRNMDAYINTAFQTGKNKMKLTKKDKQIVRDMNQIVENGMAYYRNSTNIDFNGFSDIVRDKLRQVQNENLKTGQRIVTDAASKQEARATYREQLLRELKEMAHGEMEALLNTNISVLNESRYVEDYPTKKALNIISINGGYGGVFMSGIDSIDIGTSPYVGFSFPLGKKSMAAPFWSNTSMNVGVFINNFKDDSGVELTGPIFKRPYYVGLGYKVFRFVRVNAGATFLEDISTAGVNGINDLTGLGDRVVIRPMIGISAEIKLWTSLAE